MVLEDRRQFRGSAALFKSRDPRKLRIMVNPQRDPARSSSATVAPTEEIRSHFPALDRVPNTYPAAYLDGPGGTQVPRAVGEADVDYLYHHNANTHWEYPT